MYKNKFHCSFLLGALLVLTTAQAQTIDDLTVAPRDRSIPTPGVNLPSPGTAMPSLAASELAKGSAGGKKGVFLTGIFLSRESSQVEFEIDGKSSYFGVGDRLKDGWLIEKINAQSVDLSKCSSKKHCNKKTILLSGA